MDLTTSNYKNLKSIFKGFDVVIDLAAHSSVKTPWDMVASNNIQSTYNVIKAASESGIKPGDIITKLNDIQTPDMNKFLGALWKLSPGDKISVEFYRNQTKNIVTLTLIERP